MPFCNKYSHANVIKEYIKSTLRHECNINFIAKARKLLYITVLKKSDGCNKSIYVKAMNFIM